MLFNIFQLAVLLVASILLVALFRVKWLALTLSVVLAAFLSLQISSLYMGGGLIDYKYYLHTDFVDFDLIREFFLWQAIVLAVVFVALSFAFYWLSRRLRQRTRKPWGYLVAFVLSTALLFLPGGMASQLYDISEMTTVSYTGFSEALAGLNIPPESYIKPDELEARPGKNIIVISLESFEQGFLRPPLDHLTPNLGKLSQDHTFFNMSQNPGSDWTAASVYTSITGFPAYFKTKPNNTFQGASHLKLSGLGQILEKAGYDLTYLMGKKEFAGMDKMLAANHFNVLSEVDMERDYPVSSWGLHDMDLFNEAKELITKKSEDGQSFALFLSTISTHLPDGIYDERLQDLVPKQRSSLEFMVAGVDYLLGDFVRFLSEKGMLEDTRFYIFPDHLIMGTKPAILEDMQTLRELYVITNAARADLSYDPDKPVGQLDLPKLILEGAQVSHNARFLCDFIPDGTDYTTYVNQHKKQIVALNEAALRTNNYEAGFTVEFSGKNNLRITSAGVDPLVKRIELGAGQVHVFQFDSRMRLKGDEPATMYDVFETDKYKDNTLRLITHIADGQLQAYLRKGKHIGVAKRGKRSVSFSSADMTVFDGWDFSGMEYRLPKYPNYQAPFDMIFLTSGTGGKGELLTPGEIRIGSHKLPIEKGVNVLTKKEEVYVVHHFEETSATDSLLQLLQQLNDQKQFYALVTQEWTTGLGQYAPSFKRAGYTVLSQLQPGETYIGYAYRGYISEYKLHKPFSITLPDHPRPGKRTQEAVEADASNPEKFIAHAGGAIDGHNYTNSKDALDLSYQKGYRLMELDIIKTSDGQYVAAHDWGFWRQLTNYKGLLPVTAKEFLQYKIKGRYTPMDMDAINAWFRDHPDAILVTDKVNEPEQFAAQFVDKDRLIMELFSLEAVDEAIRAGVKVMPSEKVLDAIKGDKITWLQGRGIQQVAHSRIKFQRDLPFFKACKANGIRVYVYHVNAELGKDEAFVLCNDFDYVFGMYADNWMIE